MKSKQLKIVIAGIILIFITSGFNTSFSENVSLKAKNDETSVFYESNNYYIGNDSQIFDNSLYDTYLYDSKSPSELKFIPGEFIVKFKSGVNFEVGSNQENKCIVGITTVDLLGEQYNVLTLEKIFSFKEISSINTEGLPNIYKYTVPKDSDILSIVKEYNKDPNVEYAEPNYIYHTFNIPNDPYFDEQWALNQSNDCDIDAPEAWAIETGNSDLKIAVIDSGVDYNHEDLESNIWYNSDEIPDNEIDDDNNGFIDDVIGFDFVDIDTNLYESEGFELLSYEDYTDDDNDPMDVLGHGTHCAGIIGGVGNNGIGISGVCWNCSIMPVRAGFKVIYNGKTSGLLESDDIAKAIYYSVYNDADVISMSFGAGSSSDIIRDAINYASDNGVILVASAGNDNKVSKNYPAGLECVIAVAASNETDKEASFSNYGPWIDVTAPGVDIISTIPDNQYDRKSGTSMACPIIAGMVGLIISKKSDFTKDEILTILHSSTDPVSSSKYIGIGRINAFKAIQREMSPIAKLDPSLDGATVNRLVDVYGTANGSSFHNFSLYVGEGVYPTSWVEITNSSIQVSNDILAIWDSSITKDVDVSLKLEVINNEGQASEDRTLVSIKNVDIVHPLNNDIFRLGEVIEINGTLFKSNFLKYKIEYQRGLPIYIPDTGWNTDGITLTNDGFNTVINGTMGTWDTSVLSEKDYYKLRINISLNDSENEYIKLGRIYLDPALKKGWPQQISWDETWAGSLEPVITDINKDGINEMIIFSGGVPPTIFIFGPNGEIINQWPVNVKLNHEEESSMAGGNIEFPTVVDINGDGYKEIIVRGIEKIFVFNYNGSLLRIIKFYESLDLSTPTSAIVVDDLDNDGYINFICKIRSTLNPYCNYLVVSDSEGNVLDNWPQVTIMHDTPVFLIGKSPSPALGNFDDDDDKEIVVCENTVNVVDNLPVFSGVLNVYNVNGTLLEGFPLSFNGSICTPAVGDINNDGYDEIVISISRFNDNDNVYVLDRFGNISDRWPKLYGPSFPVLADLNNDNYLEIVVATLDNVYILNYKGEILSGWPKQIDGVRGYSPIVADVNGDYSPDVIVHVNGYEYINKNGIYAWNIDGTCIDSFPKVIEYAVSVCTYMPSPTIADIDNDGNTELIATSNWDSTGQDNKDRSSIYVWELDYKASSYTMHWPMPHHDPRHTSSYVKPEVDENSPEVKITKPEKALYLLNNKIRNFIFRKPFIIGKINITVDAIDKLSGISHVEFYIDDDLKHADFDYPYNYLWEKEKIIYLRHRHTIKVIAYDNAGNNKSDEIIVRKFL